MAKKNPTLHYFEIPKGLDGSKHVPGPGPTDIPPNRQPICRLGLERYELPANWQKFSQMVTTSALDEATFFLDSSFLGREEIPNTVWSALLSRRIGITPLIWSELQPWIESPFANRWFRDALLAAKQADDNSILFLDQNAWDAEIRDSANYYIELLIARKLIGHAEIASFEEANGRKPSEEESIQLLQKKVRDRGLLLARKGLNDLGTLNFTADEQLVVYAIFHALLSGHETVILTRDADILEQFYKCNFLIDTHYRAMLVADNLHDAPLNFLSQSLPYEGLVKSFFLESEIEAINLPKRILEWVLPAESNWVNIYCMRFTGKDEQMKISGITFCAESEMAVMLRHKGASKGMNTTALSGRNLHIAVSPPFSLGLGGHALIGMDELVSVENREVNRIDLNYALLEVEHFGKLHVASDIKDSTQSIGLDLASFRLEERLMFSIQPVWMDMPVPELATAFRFCDPRTTLHADISFIESQHAVQHSDGLLGNGIAITRHISDEVLANNNWSSPLKSAIKRNGREIAVHDEAADFLYRYGFGHYLGLLSFRRLFGQAIRERVQKEYGRESPESEWPQIVEHYSGIRGRRLAEDGWRRQNDPTLFYGDELIVQGVLESILNGTDAIFLTCDPLFMDQFAKLGRIIKGHYLACEFARMQVANPSLFPLYTVREANHSDDVPDLSKILCHDLNIGWEQLVLPPKPFKVNLHCWLFGTSQRDVSRFAALTFCAERPMHEMLRIKGATGGLNSEKFGGKNVRIGHSPKSVNTPVAMILDEQMVSIGSMDFPEDRRCHLRLTSIPSTDLSYATNNNEVITIPWHEN